MNNASEGYYSKIHLRTPLAEDQYRIAEFVHAGMIGSPSDGRGERGWMTDRKAV